MKSLLTQELQHELEADQLRMAAYRTRVERRRRDRRANLRRIAGTALISAGERICGCTGQAAVADTALRRA